jgi:hypothetical protein
MRILLNVIVLLFFLQCASGFYKKERIYLSDNTAVYLIDEDAYPDDKELKKYIKPVKNFPDDAIKKISLVLTNLEVEKEGLFSKDIYPLVYPQQMEQLQDILKDILPNVPPKKRILIVQKFDPFRTVLSKDKRSTMLLWYDEDGYNIVFGEIHEDLLPDSFSSETNWLDIFPVSLKQNNPKQKILKKDFITFKQMGDFTHYNWIIFSDVNLEQVKLPVQKNQNKDTIEERLKKLKELYDKNLITKEDYEKRKKEILQEL